MAKKLQAKIRHQLEAGKASPAPPVGPALAAHGVNLMGFCKEYNARTQNRTGEIIPADISIFTAAVADYTPISVAKSKIKKNDDNLTISLLKTIDILF